MARRLSQKEIEAQRIRDGRNNMADELSKVPLVSDDPRINWRVLYFYVGEDSLRTTRKGSLSV